jgi:hypothetical protein
MYMYVCIYVCMYMRFVRLINPEQYFALLFYFCMHVRTCEPQIVGFFKLELSICTMLFMYVFMYVYAPLGS